LPFFASAVSGFGGSGPAQTVAKWEASYMALLKGLKFE
jgi:hypothetical protein